MEQTTQTNRTHIEYISIYDKPKRGKGRPQGSKYTVEERAGRARLSTMTYYYNNIGQERETSRVYQAKNEYLNLNSFVEPCFLNFIEPLTTIIYK